VQTYLIHRPGIAADANELDAALMRLRAFEEQPAALQAQWLHSYALHGHDGRLGLACVFRAADVTALRRHADSTQLAAVEISPVVRTLVVRPFAPTRVHMVRRRRAWRTVADLERNAALARRVADEQMARQLCWLRSYVVREHDDTLGSVCLFQAIDAGALAEHAERSGVTADEITAVIGRIVFREEA
jgi:hypothetical protein